MRIKQKYKQGDTRVKRTFAFLPIVVNYAIDQKETRWLEMVTVEQVLLWDIYRSKYYWKNTKFL